jgi:hypothetical protein
MLPDEDGLYQFYLYAARGVSSALEPVNHHMDKLIQIALACEEQRTTSD